MTISKVSQSPAAKYPRPSYSQLEGLCADLRAENGSLKATVAQLTESLRVEREEHEQEQREQQAAAEQLFEALRDFCQQPTQNVPSQSNVLTTPRLGVESRASTGSWADLENKVNILLL